MTGPPLWRTAPSAPSPLLPISPVANARRCLGAVYSHAYAWARRWIVTGSDTRGRDQSAPSDPIKTDAKPPLIRTKAPLIVSSASRDSSISPPPPIPSSPSACPRQGLPDFAIRPRDKHQGCFVHKAAAWCSMLTQIASLHSSWLALRGRRACSGGAVGRKEKCRCMPTFPTVK